jgi:hypothetical protein
MRVLATLTIPALVCAAAVACYPDQMDSLTQTASVTTLVDSQAPLRDARTFAMPDTIVAVNGVAGVVGVVGHDSEKQILTRIRESLISRGWRDVTDIRAEKPDVVVLTAVVVQGHTGAAYGDWWSAWGFWPGWGVTYSADWVWSSPDGTVTFTYETGTLLITMLDRHHDDTINKRVPLLWAAGVNAVLVPPTANLDLAIAGIDQAFAQSPYLVRQ